MATTFNINNVQELVSYHLYLDRHLKSAVSLFAKHRKNRDKLEKVFGREGVAALFKLEEYLNDCSSPKVAGQKTVEEAIKEEIYAKADPAQLKRMEKYNLSSKRREKWSDITNSIYANPSIDWYTIVRAYHDKFDFYDRVKGKLTLGFGDALETDASFLMANTNQVLEGGLLEKEKATKKGLFVGAGVTAAALVAMIGILVGVNTQLKELESSGVKVDNNQAFVNYFLNEVDELNEFKTMFDKMNNDGDGITVAEKLVLDTEIGNFARTDDLSKGYASTNEMKVMLENAQNESIIANNKVSYSQLQTKYDDLDKKYAALLASNPSAAYDYVQVLNDIVRVAELMSQSLVDNNLSSQEKTTLTDEITKLGGYQDAVADALADKFGISMETVVNSIDFQVADLSSKIDDLNKKIDDLEKDNSKLEDKVDSKNSTISTLRGDISDLNAEIKRLEDLLNNAGSSNNQALLDQISKLKGELTTAQQKITTLEAENKSLSQQVSDLSSDVSRLTSEITGLNKSIDDLRKSNTDLSKERDNAVALNADYLKQVNELNNKYSDMVAKYNAEVKNYNDLYADYEELNKLYEQALKAGDAQELAKLQNQLNQKIAELQKMQASLDKASSEIDTLENQIANLEKQVENLTNMLSSSDSGFMGELYYKITGINPSTKTQAEIIAELGDMFDIQIDTNSGAMGDEGSQPQNN